VVPKYFPKILVTFKLRIWQQVTMLRTGVRWPPACGRARIGKPLAGLG